MASLQSTSITGSLYNSGSVVIESSGSTVFDVQGSQGQLFAVTDELSGSLFSVNDISGIPILQVFSDNTVNLGTFNDEAIIVNGNTASITGSLEGTSSYSDNSDLLDGQEGSYYLNFNNHTNKPTLISGSSEGDNQGQIKLNGQNVNTNNLGTDDSPSFAGLTVDTNTLYVDATNNRVGIGTTSPSAELHTTGVGYFSGGTISFTDTVTNAGIVIDEEDYIYTKDNLNLRKLIGKSLDVIRIGESGTSLIDEIRLLPGSSGIVTVYDNTAEVARFTGGNVGIGTTSPTNKLHIYNNSTQGTPESHTSTGATLHIQDSSNSLYLDGNSIIGTGVGTLHIGNQSNTPMNLWTNGLNRLHITADGNIGIGTDSPSYKLDIHSGTGVDDRIGLRLKNNGTGDGDAILYLDSSATGESDIDFMHDGSLNWRFRTGEASLNTNTNFNINNASNSQILTLEQGGNVGIGTSSPSQKLTVEGNISGSGNLDIDGNTTIDGTLTVGGNSVLTTADEGSGNGIDADTVDGLEASQFLRNDQSGTLTGDLTVTGKITAEEFHTEFVSASIIYQSGSTKFGDTSDDVHSFTGSIQQSGSDSYFLGNVGIRTTSPSYELDVSGSIGVSNRIQVDEGINIGITGSDARLHINQYFSGENDLTVGNLTLSSRSVGMLIEASGLKSGNNLVRPGIYMFNSRTDTSGLAFPLFKVYTGKNDSYSATNGGIFGALASNGGDQFEYLYFGVNNKQSYDDNVVKITESGMGILLSSTTEPSYTLDVNGDIRVTDDLFVDDFARIDALRVGTTATDPGDGNLYVEGNSTLVGTLTVGGNSVLTTADEGSGNGLDADTVDGLQASQFLRSDANDTTTGDLTISKDQPTLTLSDNNTSTTNFPRIIFDTNNNQGVMLYHDEFDTYLPETGYGLVLGPSPNNTQFPATGNLTLQVLGSIYADSETTGSGYKVLTTADEGSGNGLDADTLDGNHASAFYLASNPSGYTSNTGTVTSVGITAGTGLSGGGTVTTSGTISLAVDLSELTDMTATMVGTDEFIVLDASADRRKAANEIGLSIFNNDSGFTTNTGTVTSVGGTGTVNGLTLTGTVTTTGNLTLGGDLTINNDDWSGTDLSLANGGTGASLTDPNADRILFWDDSAGAVTWLSAGTNITISGTTISATDTNTTYSAGNGITLTGTTFSVAAGGGLTQDAGGLSHSDTSTLSGTYGSTSDGTKIDQITVDAYGHITAITTGNTGDILGVTAGSGLTGGGSSGTVTLNVGAGTGIDVAADAISVDVSDFMTNGADNRVVTATGTDAMNAEQNLTFDGSNLSISKSGLSGTNTITLASSTPAHSYTYDVTITLADPTLLGNASRTVSIPALDDLVSPEFVLTELDQTINGRKFFNSQVVINEGGSSAADFRVESDTNTHMLFVDAGTNKVGIGTSSPQEVLDVNVGATENIRFGTYTSTGFIPALSFNNDFSSGGMTGFAAGGIVDSMYLLGESFEMFTGTAGRSRAFVVTSGGRIGMGAFGSVGNIDAHVHIKQSANSDTGGIRLEDASNAAVWWNIYNDGGDELQIKNQSGNGGYLDSATDVSNIDFTGQHRSLTSSEFDSGSIEDLTGLIVVADGSYTNFDGSTKATINEALPNVKLSETENDKKVFGVISDTEDLKDGRKYAMGNWVSVYTSSLEEQPRLVINSVGEGGIWVCNYSGSFENGDYITTSPIKGLGMNQNSPFLMNYTVGKITQDCDFSDSSEYIEFEYSGSIYRKQFVGCTYHCG